MATSIKISLNVYKSICLMVIAFGIMLLLVSWPNSIRAQEALDEKKSETRVDDLVFLENEYSNFVKQGTELQNRFERIIKVFADSERDLQQIQNEELRQQRNQADADIRQMFLQMRQQSALASLNSSRSGPPGRNLAPNDLRDFSNEISIEQARLGLERFARSQQMAQLSAAQQAVFQKFQQAMGDYQVLSVDFQKWLTKSAEYLPRYWRFCDPEGMNSSEVNEQRMLLLKQAEPSNPFALLARGLLAMRMDDESQAEECLSRLSKNGGAVSPIADAGLALLYTNKKQKQKAQESLRKAKVGQANFAVSSPYVSWLFAQESLVKGVFPVAIKELDRLTEGKDLDLPARRQISLIRSIEGKTKNKPSERNLKNIRLVSDFVGTDDWYTELIYAMCLYANNDRKYAITKAEHALEIAPKDRREDCEQVLQQIVDEQELRWVFWK